MYLLNQIPLYGFIFSVGRIHRSQKQRIESGVASLTITPYDPLGDFVILVPTTLGSAGLETLATKEGILLPGDTVKWAFSCQDTFTCTQRTGGKKRSHYVGRCH